MRLLIGCSGAIALVFFVIGFAGALFARDASWSERLFIAAMPAGTRPTRSLGYLDKLG